MNEIDDKMLMDGLSKGLGAIVKACYPEDFRAAMDIDPGIWDIYNQINMGKLGFGGTEICGYEADLEVMKQAIDRADEFVADVEAQLDEWLTEHSLDLGDVVGEAIELNGGNVMVKTIRDLAGSLGVKQDAFPPILLAVYLLRAGGYGGK